jgi:protein-S-isoprenylcysteine O-methyltransferase Ste14
LCKQEGNATFAHSHDLQELTLPDYAVFIARCILFAAAHSLFAANSTKQTFRRLAGRELHSYRLLYNLASLAMFSWVMAAYRASPLLYTAPGIWKWVLYSAQTAVAVVLFRCVRQTGSGDFLGINQLRSSVTHPCTLVTSGWYARMRHPLYFYSTLFLVLNPVMTAQWLLLTVFAVAYFILGGMIEERRLLQVYGAEYREYQQRVPFMIPAIKSTKPV